MWSLHESQTPGGPPVKINGELVGSICPYWPYCGIIFELVPRRFLLWEIRLSLSSSYKSTVDSRKLEPSRELEKSLSYRELKENTAGKKEKNIFYENILITFNCKKCEIRGTQRGYSSKALNIALLNVF